MGTQTIQRPVYQQFDNMLKLKAQDYAPAPAGRCCPGCGQKGYVWIKWVKRQRKECEFCGGCGHFRVIRV